MSARALISNRLGLRFQRRIHAARGGLVQVEQRIESQGTVERAVVTGAFWIYAAACEESGLTEARSAGRWLPLPARRAFLIPPRSLLWLRLSDVRLVASGIVGRVALPARLASAPRVAVLGHDDAVPTDLLQIGATLDTGVTIDPDAGVPECARQARRLLHDARAHPSPVREAARALFVDPDTVTRAFRSAYLMSPKAYVQSARVSDAVLSLIAGAGVLQAAFDAGFNDLSRFYRAFRRLTGNTPGEYASLHDRKAPRP